MIYNNKHDDDDDDEDDEDDEDDDAGGNSSLKQVLIHRTEGHSFHIFLQHEWIIRPNVQVYY